MMTLDIIKKLVDFVVISSWGMEGWLQYDTFRCSIPCTWCKIWQFFQMKIMLTDGVTVSGCWVLWAYSFRQCFTKYIAHNHRLEYCFPFCKKNLAQSQLYFEFQIFIWHFTVSEGKLVVLRPTLASTYLVTKFKRYIAVCGPHCVIGAHLETQLIFMLRVGTDEVDETDKSMST